MTYIRFYSQWSSDVLLRTLWLISVDIPAIITIPRVRNCKNTFGVLNRLYEPVKFSSPPPFGLSVMTDHVMPVLHVCREVSGWPNKRAWEQIVDIWPILLKIKDLLLFITGHRWCRALAKVTKRVKIEKSKLFFVIPKTISVIPYPYNFLVCYPLSLKLFWQLSLIPKTPNRAS